MVCAPAGSGKTLVASGTLRSVVMAKPRTSKVNVGWMANTREQIDQARKAVETFPEMLPHIDVKYACAAADTDWSRCDVLICDEAHHCVADGWFRQVSSCRGARWAFTATPPEDPDEFHRIMELFDHQFYEIDRKDCAENLAPARVIILHDTDQNIAAGIDSRILVESKKRRNYWLGGVIPKKQAEITRLRNAGASQDEIGRCIGELAGLERQMAGQCAFQCCVDRGIVNNYARNEAIIREALKRPTDSVVILVGKIEHGEAIAERIPGCVPCSSKMGAKKRRQTLADFQAGKIKCITASSMLDEGWDASIANVLIMASGGRSNAKSEQRSGRVLRQHQGKTHGLVLDWADEFHPLMRRHSEIRQQLYRSLGYEWFDNNRSLM